SGSVQIRTDSQRVLPAFCGSGFFSHASSSDLNSLNRVLSIVPSLAGYGPTLFGWITQVHERTAHVRSLALSIVSWRLGQMSANWRVGDIGSLHRRRTISRRRFVTGLVAGGVIAGLGGWRWPAFAENAAGSLMLSGNSFSLVVEELPVNFTGRP